MQAELADLGSKIERSKMESSREGKELERLCVSIQQVKVSQQEYIQRNTPDIAPHLPLLPTTSQFLPPPNSPDCSLSSCFDFSHCSVTSHLPTFLYPTTTTTSSTSTNSLVAASLLSLQSLPTAPDTYCLDISILEPGNPPSSLP